MMCISVVKPIIKKHILVKQKGNNNKDKEHQTIGMDSNALFLQYLQMDGLYSSRENTLIGSKHNVVSKFGNWLFHSTQHNNDENIANEGLNSCKNSLSEVKQSKAVSLQSASNGTLTDVSQLIQDTPKAGIKLRCWLPRTVAEQQKSGSVSCCCRKDEQSIMETRIRQLEAQLSEAKIRLETVELQQKIMAENFNRLINQQQSASCQPAMPSGFIPPPPPPPPPPPTPLSTRNCISDLIRKNKSRVSTEKAKDNGIDMAEVLKGLRFVKLRQIARSPGGTPLRQKSDYLDQDDDPASMLARALRKKFANHRVMSSDVKRRSPECSGWSPQRNDTPAAIPGPHLLKTSKCGFKRRSNCSPLAVVVE